MENKYLIRLHLLATFGVAIAAIEIIGTAMLIIYSAVMLVRTAAPTQGMIMVMAALSMALAVFEARLFKSLKACDSPFSGDVIKKLDGFVVMLAIYIICSIIVAALQQFMNMDLGGSWNIGNGVTLIIMLILANSFRYGVKLQRESDETL